MKRILIFVITGILVLFCLNGPAQEIPDSTKVFRIETKDGNVFTGQILSEDLSVLVLRTEKLGELKISQVDILSKSEITGTVKVGDQYWLPNPQSSRYFWAPNGYGLKKGEAWYQNIWVFYNQVSFALSDYFSFGVGCVPLFLFAGAPTPIWIVPKFSIPIAENKFNLGAGTFLATVIGEETAVFGLFYGTATFGSRDKNVSLGMAYGFVDDEFTRVPVFNFSGLLRTGPRGYLVSENYFISVDGESGVLLSAGGRTIIRNVGIDYSLWIPLFPDMGTFVAAPFLGMTIPISSKSK